MLNTLWGLPPALDMDYEKRVHDGHAARSSPKGLAESAHDISDGGLAVALAECCLRASEHRRAAMDLRSDLTRN